MPGPGEYWEEQTAEVRAGKLPEAMRPAAGGDRRGWGACSECVWRWGGTVWGAGGQDGRSWVSGQGGLSK